MLVKLLAISTVADAAGFHRRQQDTQQQTIDVDAEVEAEAEQGWLDISPKYKEVGKTTFEVLAATVPFFGAKHFYDERQKMEDDWETLRKTYSGLPDVTEKQEAEHKAKHNSKLLSNAALIAVLVLVGVLGVVCVVKRIYNLYAYGCGEKISEESPAEFGAVFGEEVPAKVTEDLGEVPGATDLGEVPGATVTPAPAQKKGSCA